MEASVWAAVSKYRMHPTPSGSDREEWHKASADWNRLVWRDFGRNAIYFFGALLIVFALLVAANLPWFLFFLIATPSSILLFLWDTRGRTNLEVLQHVVRYAGLDRVQRNYLTAFIAIRQSGFAEEFKVELQSQRNLLMTGYAELVSKAPKPEGSTKEDDVARITALLNDATDPEAVQALGESLRLAKQNLEKSDPISQRLAARAELVAQTFARFAETVRSAKASGGRQDQDSESLREALGRVRGQMDDLASANAEIQA
ncbi:MAG: hypothetical protein ABUL72_04380, partial [Armatimonadota bacterium]